MRSPQLLKHPGRQYKTCGTMKSVKTINLLPKTTSFYGAVVAIPELARH
jgi:hypothetical protein